MRTRLRKFIQRQSRRLAHRRHFVSSVRASDVFLVTYPKSGTTWLAYMLAEVRAPGADGQTELREQLQHLPDINRLYLASASLHPHAALPDPRVFRVHAPYDVSFPKVVYVLRDPRAVMVSYWHFKRLSEANFTRTLKEFIAADAHWPCRWDEHVAGWLFQHRHPRLLVVRYEELHADPAAVLARVLDFAGIAYTPAGLARAVGAGQFERMHALETQSALEPAWVERGERFFRRGRVDSWRDELDADDVRTLEGKYQAVMRKAGYAPSA